MCLAFLVRVACVCGGMRVSAPCGIRNYPPVRTSRASNSPHTQNTAGARPFPRPGGPIFVTLAVLDEGAAVLLYLARRWVCFCLQVRMLWLASLLLFA